MSESGESSFENIQISEYQSLGQPETRDSDNQLGLRVGVSLTEARPVPFGDTKQIYIENAPPGKKTLNGEIATVNDLPEIVYHMSPFSDAISSSGVIKMPGIERTGIGGNYFNTQATVSLTERKDVAENLRDNLKDLIKAAKEQVNPNSIEEIAKRDEARYGLPPGSLDASISTFKETYNTFLYSNDMSEGDRLCEATTSYFHSRDELRGVSTPSIFGNADSRRDLDPEKVDVISIPRENLFRSGALVRYNLTPQNKAVFAEVVVHGDVPLR